MYFLEQNNYRIRREDKTLQYKNKKNLYKIVFITILLGFIISLAGCDWLSLGIINIFDPQAQIRIDFIPKDEKLFNLEVYSINEVEFFISGFIYDYHGNKYNAGTIDIPELSRVWEVSYYVKPSSSPGTPGDVTLIENIPIYFKNVENYMKKNPLITEITCDIYLIGTDGSGHNLNILVVSGLTALQPGIDFSPPVANILTTPASTAGVVIIETLTLPVTVVFDASGSTDNTHPDDRGIASYTWDFGDNTSGTAIIERHKYYSYGTYIVILTVTDYFGNKDYDTKTITVKVP